VVKFITREFKTAINKLKYPDSWFWIRYTINPYSGCEHACIYCDARSQRYYLEQDFENEVIIKADIDKKLELRLKRARTLLPDVIGAGGVNDAYQPIEEKVENTRKILKVIERYGYPLNIATKSRLIVRDTDLLERIGKHAWCAVGFSITTTDEDLASFLEPHSSPPHERLEAIREIKNKTSNVLVGTFFMPIIPYLEDDDENLTAVIKESKKAGADFVLFSPGLTLRDVQAEFFIKKLENSKYQGIIKPLLSLYRGKYYPSRSYMNKIHSKLLGICEKYHVPIRIKRWIPRDFRKWNYKLSEILLNHEYMKSLRGKPDNAMKWAGLHLNNLGESILDVYKRGELAKLPNFNNNIIKFVEPYLERSKELKAKKGLERFL